MATRNYQVRSISLPSKSHPSILKIHEELYRLRSLESSSPCTSEIVYSSLAGLAELYTCVDDFLNIKSTREAFSHDNDARCVSELLDGSVHLLDVCRSLRDGMMEVKENVQGLRSSLRRRKGDSSIENSICSYACLRKKMKKDSKNMIASLNQMANRLQAPAVQESDSSYSSVVQILIQVNVATIQALKSLLIFLSTPLLTRKASKWSLVSKIRHKKVAAAAWEDVCVNEFTSVDVTLLSSSSREGSCKKDYLIPNERLVLLERSLETIETHLERIFRNLVTSRVSLLNIFSQQ